LKEKKMLKDKTSWSKKRTTKPTKDGRLSTKPMLKKNRLQELTNILDSESTSHSTLDQECQWEELLNAWDTTMLS